MKIIGIISGHTLGMKDRFKDYHRSYANQTYVKTIAKSGAIPVILPLIDSAQEADQYLKLVGGIVLTGGSDIDPALFGEKLLPESKNISKIRDQTDTLYYQAARKAKKPVLAICRGMQIVNAIEGGTLYQDLKYFPAKRKMLKHDQFNNPTKKTHKINIKQKSFIHKALQKTTTKVNSFHHQVINQIAPNFEAIAHAPDGVIEAMVSTKKPLVLAVQWHPEMTGAKDDKESLQLVRAFIKEIDESKNYT